MPLSTVAEIATRQDAGRSFVSPVYKPTVAAAAFAGGWVDASMSAGTPIYNAYVGGQLEATPLFGAGNRGIYTGSIQGQRLAQALFQTRSAVVPATVLLMDYLLFYPLVDLDSTDLQETTATGVLPRFATGAGVRIMPVVTTPSSSAALCTVVYTNEKGVLGRTVTFALLPGTITGNVIASGANATNNDANNPFVPLAPGDAGVRSIQSITLASPVGGFASFVLVRPLSTIVVPEINTCSEIALTGMKFQIPPVPAGAYINFAIKTQAVATSSWLAQLTFVED